MLKAWIAHADADPLTAWVHQRSDAHAFQAQVRELGATGRLAIAGAENMRPLVEAGALWLADPAIGRHAWERRWYRQSAWSIVGITHTISSGVAMDHLANLLTAPVQPWDALICTSRAVRRVVQTLLEHQAAYLAGRLGATTCTGPELPIIPLGVDCAALAADQPKRKLWRDKLRISPDHVAILHFGRLSLHLKAHPQPLYLALKETALRGGPRLHLILAGQPTNPAQDKAIRGLASSFEDHVTTHFVDGAAPDAGDVRAAADIFTLFSDNIQESFGLAPVEAMAAGLPVVGSDFDGLRDTIEHGLTGFLIDSVMPGPGAGEWIARDHALGAKDYHHYVGSVAQSTAINVMKAADAFATLAADEGLRRKMGAAGRKRALELFDWPKVIAAYRDLLDHLAVVRSREKERAPKGNGQPAQPSRMDPYALFAAYPTAALAASTLLVGRSAIDRVEELTGGEEAAILVRDVLPEASVLNAMLGRIRSESLTLKQLVTAFAEQDPRRIAHGVAWLLKFDLIRRG